MSEECPDFYKDPDAEAQKQIQETLKVAFQKHHKKSLAAISWSGHWMAAFEEFIEHPENETFDKKALIADLLFRVEYIGFEILHELQELNKKR